MLRFLDRFSLEARFWIGLALPLVAIVWMTTMGALERHREASNLREVERLSQLTVQVGSLVHQLQAERGASLGYLGSEGRVFYDTVPAARAATDRQFSQLRKRLDQGDYSFLEKQEMKQQALFRQFSLPGVTLKMEESFENNDTASFRIGLEDIILELQGLSGVRQRIDDLSIRDQEALDYYTNINLKLSTLTARLAHQTRHAEIARKIAAYYAFMMYKELAGLERARVNYMLSNATFTASHRRELHELWGEQRAFHTTFLRLTDTSHSEQLQAALQRHAHPERASLRQILREDMIESDSSLLDGTLPTAVEWFVWQTGYINQLKVVEDSQASAIMSWAIDKRKMASFALWRYLVISPLSVLIALLLLYFIARSSRLRLKVADTLFNHAHDGITVTDRDANIIDTNRAFTWITGYAREEVVGKNSRILQSGRQGPEFYQEMWHQLTTTGRWRGEVWNRRKGGRLYAELLTISAVRDKSGNPKHYIAIFSDITQRAQAEQQLAHRATHDDLTGLGNRSLLEDRLTYDAALAKRHNTQLAVLFIDLDEFKPINDTFGHNVGDQLLISVAGRLQQGRRATDTLIRLGGDEFVLLLPDLSAAHDAERIAGEMLAALNQPHRIGSYELHVSASIGIAYLTEELEAPDSLVRQADMAMYQAKQQGRNTYSVYLGDEDQHLFRRIQLRNQLREAIDTEQLVLHYQPIVDCRGEAVLLEALVRWQHPEQGFISPADFIPLAEETGQIIPLGRWVMERACRDAKALIDAGLFQGRVAVNLSPLQFHRPQFLDALSNMLADTGLPAKHLELELTEGILMRDSKGATDQLHALAGMGVTTAIDDFGTGYSSLAYLKNLPVHRVKIDRSFVSHIVDSRSDMAICQGVLTLASELGLSVVAEGIETEAQRNVLRQMGCPLFQGYWFARPMPLAALESWLEEQTLQPQIL